MAGASHGGAETAFVDMCLAMAQSGVSLCVASRANKRLKPLIAQDIPVLTLPFGGPLDFYTGWLIRRAIHDFHPDIIQTWMSRAARHIPKNPGVPVVSRLGGYYNLRYYTRTDYFTTITPDIREHLIAQGIHPDRVRHINNFAETEDRPADPASRAALETPESAPLLLALGRLHHSKALDVLLRALPSLPGVYLWIAGEGPQRAELEALRDTLGLADRVRFLGWREDRGALFASCDVCVFPSRYEPFGTVFVQAWAHGKPLVAAAADGPRQYVRDGEDGLLVPVDDSQALTAAIQRVLDNETLRDSLVRKGRAHYESAFTKEKTVAAYLDFYREILDIPLRSILGQKNTK